VTRDSYRLLARCFEAIEAFYSGGAIAAAKAAELPYSTGKRVLYVGAGSASEAVLAARGGAHITLLEPSPAMADEARARFARAGLPEPRLHATSLFGFDEEHEVVVANFFLNIFLEARARAAVDALRRLVASDGVLVVADFAPFRPRALFQRFYWYLAWWVASRFTGDPRHPVYDFGALCARGGFRLVERFDFRVFRFGPAWYRVWVFRPDPEPELGQTAEEDGHHEDRQGHHHHPAEGGDRHRLHDI